MELIKHELLPFTGRKRKPEIKERRTKKTTTTCITEGCLLEEDAKVIRVEDELLPITARRKRKLEDRPVLSRRRSKITRTKEDIQIIQKGEWLGDAHSLYSSLSA